MATLGHFVQRLGATPGGHGIQPSIRTENSKRLNRFTRNRRHIGETLVDIDVASATGPPIGANAVLKAKPTVQLTTEQFIEKLSEVLGKKNCDCDNKKDAAGANAAKKSPSTNP